MVFDCATTPAVCTNMCWGAYCAGFDVSLEWDDPSDSTKQDRRNKAGCGKPNRCNDGQGNNPDPSSRSCDEYPFASTSNADQVQQVNRCVPKSEQDSKCCTPARLHSISWTNMNGKGTVFKDNFISLIQLHRTNNSSAGQGGTISSYYQNNLGGNPGEFIVSFGNPDANAVQYCDYDQHCLNDGNQYCGDDLCPDGVQSPPGSKLRKRYRYMLESGMPIVSPRELGNGTEVRRVAKRTEAEMTLRARGAADPWELVQDRIVRSLEED